MSKFLNLTLAFSILASSYGCVGKQPQPGETAPSFPYATPEIKQQIAKNIYNTNTPIPEDFFETASYFVMFQTLMDKGTEVFGDNIEQQTFWYYLFRLRFRIMEEIGPHQIDDMRLGAAYTEMMQSPFLSFIEQNPEKGLTIFADVIRYEETFPFNPQKEVEEKRQKIKNTTKEEYLAQTGLAEISDEDLARQKEMSLQWIEDVPDTFAPTRQAFLEAYKQELNRLKSGKSSEEFIQEKKEERGIAEYTVHFQAPKLYPAEIFFAEFQLSPTDEEMRYSYPKIYIQNGGNLNSIRLENEKPLPHKIDLIWYSIIENKSYLLQAFLPFEEIKEKIMNSDAEWDAILFTLAPYGLVELFAFNQANGNKKLLAFFQAKEKDLSLQDFRLAGAEYENPSSPAEDWAEYQQNALKSHPQAAQHFEQNGLPKKDENFWEEK